MIMSLKERNGMEWDQHISTVSSKASQVLGVVQRNLHNCPRLVRETAYPRICKCRMGSPLREGYSKAGKSSEKGSAILHAQLQPLCKRDRYASGT